MWLVTARKRKQFVTSRRESRIESGERNGKRVAQCKIVLDNPDRGHGDRDGQWQRFRRGHDVPSGSGGFADWGGPGHLAYDPSTFTGFIDWAMIVFGIAFMLIMVVGLSRHDALERAQG